MRTMLRTRIRPMAEGDLAQVAEIERESFPSAWPQTAYRRELQNSAARYLVLAEEAGEGTAQPWRTAAPGRHNNAAPGRQSPTNRNSIINTLRRIAGVEAYPIAPPERVLGFVGIWLMVGEAHIVTFAVREDYRRGGVGERLLIACIEMAMEYDQQVITLEVRKSNQAAQRLYEKYGLDAVGTRIRYYTDNGEDAVIMTSPELASPSYGLKFGALRMAHQQRYPELWEA